MDGCAVNHGSSSRILAEAHLLDKIGIADDPSAVAAHVHAIIYLVIRLAAAGILFAGCCGGRRRSRQAADAGQPLGPWPRGRSRRWHASSGIWSRIRAEFLYYNGSMMVAVVEGEKLGYIWWGEFGGRWTRVQ
jgi:hypothetical protein